MGERGHKSVKFWSITDQLYVIVSLKLDVFDG